MFNFDEAAAVEVMARAFSDECDRMAPGDGQPPVVWETLDEDSQDRFRQASRASLAALKPFLGGWRTMESAPQDGKWIMGWAERDSAPYRISWGRNHDNRLAWCTTSGSFHDGYITHWMPLEPLPRISRQGRGMMAKRIQIKRTRGWKMPPNTVSVARPSRWGNPFKIGETIDWLIPPDAVGPLIAAPKGTTITRELAIEQYRRWMQGAIVQDIIAELRGKDLACFCPLDQPCHADVLLEIANPNKGR